MSEKPKVKEEKSCEIRAEVITRDDYKLFKYEVRIISPDKSFETIRCNRKENAELIVKRINEPNRIVKLIDEMIKEREGTPEYIGKTKNALESLKSRIEGGK